MACNIDVLGIADVIEFSINGKDLSKGKPYPEPYLLAVEKLSLQPGRCIAIEDLAVGIASAGAAGLITLAWTIA